MADHTEPGHGSRQLSNLGAALDGVRPAPPRHPVDEQADRACAVYAAARWARDAEDLRDLLDMLGLDPNQDAA